MVNLMLDEIVRLLQQIKSVGDNIAHDLRSPLAVMRTKLERDLAADSGQELRAAAEGALGDLGQALATVTALLRIAEIESGRRGSGFTCVDLVFELYEPLAEAKPVAFTLDAPAPLPVRGDFELLVEAIAKSNSHREAAVAIVARTKGDRPAVRVTDNVLRAEGDRIGGQSFSLREHALAA
jgi:signal transduction histidine kinase